MTPLLAIGLLVGALLAAVYGVDFIVRIVHEDGKL